MASLYTCVLLICLVLSITSVNGHIPMDYNYKSAEPDAPIYDCIYCKYSEVSDASPRDDSASPSDRLAALRLELSEAQVDAYIVPTGDAHNVVEPRWNQQRVGSSMNGPARPGRYYRLTENRRKIAVPTAVFRSSQYIAPADARREWLSGLRGSSGTAVVTMTRALVWTDARYWTQFEVEVDGNLWTLMRQGTDLSIQDWLVQNMQAGSVVAVDPTTYTRTAWTSLLNALSSVNVQLLAISENIVDKARRRINQGPPERPNNPLLALTTQYTGRASSDKISQLVTQINAAGASALLLTALDDIAYTLNLRGSDIPYNPVFFSYLIIRADVPTNNILLFWGDGNLSNDILAHLASENTAVDCRPYEDIFSFLSSFSTELGPQGSIWVSSDGSHAVYNAIEEGPARIIMAPVTPVALMKTVKNQVELQGFRTAHIKDGIAVVRGLHWIEKQVAAGYNITEVEFSDKLEEFRRDEQNFMGPSFATIAGAGANGAIIHYKPDPTAAVQKVIEPNDMLLVDSGGQYLEGTTDITRTRHMSANPTAAQRLAFTRVLKGQINLGTAVVPRGTLGHVIEVLARKHLWDVGLNYGHGTGHGVGHFLNVHEGPAWILSGPSANDPGISPAMIYSNEPGYYEVGEYGIRHEDLVETIEMTTDADHPYAAGLVGYFEGRGAVGFYTISLAPHQTACLDVDLMSDFEIKFLNDYHARVFSTLGPILESRNLTEEYEWLEKECAPIARSAAILFKPTSILAAISVTIVWLGL